MTKVLIRRFQIPRRSSKEKEVWREILSELNEQLEKWGLIGRVSSVIIYQEATKVVHCYGHFIPSAVLFGVLNLSTDHSIRYHGLGELKHRQINKFIPLKKFEPRYDDDRWVGMINIPDND